MKVWKRCLAAVLSFVTFLTSVNISNAAGAYDKKYSVWTANAADIVAEHYNFSDKELDVLYNDAINAGYLYRVFGPYENSKGSKRNLLEVDYVNKIVYAKSYSKSGYTWMPTTAKIIANGEVVETLSLNEGITYYNEREYNASQAFTYDGNKYTVELIFELYVTIKAEEQERIMQIPIVLAQTANNIVNHLSKMWYDVKALGEMTPTLMQLLEVQFETEEVVIRTVTEPAIEVEAETEVEFENTDETTPVIIEFADEATSTVTETVHTSVPAFDPMEHAEEIEAIKALYNEFTANNGLILYGLSEKYRTSDGNILKFADEYGAQIQQSSSELFKHIDTLKASARLRNVLGKLAQTDVEMYTKLQNLQSILAKLMGQAKRPGSVRVLQDMENWKFIDKSVRSSILKTSYTKEAYADLDYAAYALRNEELGIPVIEEETLKAAEVSISCDISICKVTVTVSGEAVSGEIDSNERIAMEPATKTLVLLNGSTEKQVLDAIDNCGLEVEMLAKWNALNDDYQINIANYDRTETKLPERLQDDIADYQIVYTPKMYKVNTNFRGNEKLPYGFKMELPRSTDEELSYDYTIEIKDGAKLSYDEGAIYKVTKSVEITQLEGTEKTEHRLYDILIEDVQYQDILSADAREILASSAIDSPTLNIRVPNEINVSEVVLEDGVYSITASDYSSGIYGMTWEPFVVHVMDGDIEKESAFFKNGLAMWTENSFTHVSVEYKLKIEKVKNNFLSNRELDEIEDVLYALNLPNDLVKQAVDENEYLVAVKKVYDQLNQSGYMAFLNRNMIEMIISDDETEENDYLETDDGIKAAKLLLKDKDKGGAWNKAAGEEGDGELALCTYMKKCNNAGWSLAQYYRDEYYKEIPEQAEIVADCLRKIIDDPKAQEKLGAFRSKFESLIKILESLSGERPEPHEAMRIEDDEFPSLIAKLLDKEVNVAEVGEESLRDVYKSHLLEKHGEKRGTVSVSVKVGSKLSKVEVIPFDLENGVHIITEDDVAKINSVITDLEMSLKLTEEEKVYYAEPAQSWFPIVGKTLDKRTVLNIIYTPNTYTVGFTGMKEDYVAEFKYSDDVYSIKLPAYSKKTDELNYYCYLIKEIERPVYNGSYEYFKFEKSDLIDLFDKNHHYQAQVIMKQTYSQWDVKPVVLEDDDVIKDASLDFGNKRLYLEVCPDGIDEETFKEYISFENGLGEEKQYDIEPNSRSGNLIANSAVVTVYSENEANEAVKTYYTVILKGDVNKDGKVTQDDLQMLTDNYIGAATGESRIDPKDEITKLAADMNGNRKYDSNDAFIITRKYNYWDPVDDDKYESVLD